MQKKIDMEDDLETELETEAKQMLFDKVFYRTKEIRMEDQILKQEYMQPPLRGTGML